MFSRTAARTMASGLRDLLAQRAGPNSQFKSSSSGSSASGSGFFERPFSFQHRSSPWAACYAEFRARFASTSDATTHSSTNCRGHEYSRDTETRVNLSADSKEEAVRMFERLCRRPEMITRLYPETNIFFRKGYQPSLRFVAEVDVNFYCSVDWKGEAAMIWAS